MSRIIELIEDAVQTSSIEEGFSIISKSDALFTFVNKSISNNHLDFDTMSKSDFDIAVQNALSYFYPGDLFIIFQFHS